MSEKFIYLKLPIIAILILSCTIIADTSGRKSPDKINIETSVPNSLLDKVISQRVGRFEQISAVGPINKASKFSVSQFEKYLPDPCDIKLKDISRTVHVLLSLEDCVSRTLEHNYKIKTEGYGPAISATDILRAESIFDAVYFLEAHYNKTNQPSPSVLVSSDTDERTMTTGLTKLLPSGATITGTYNLTRLDSSLSFNTLNPSFTSNFVVELRQPLLKGFGVDYNRSGIELAKNSQRMAKWKFRRKVRDVLYDVEETYWKLVQARRNVVIQQRLVQQTRETLEYLEKRRAFDVYKVQITRVQALLGTREAEYIQVKNTVKDLEDKLKNLLNDPQLNLGEDIELIPTGFPNIGPVVLDRIAEVQQALENRSELHEAKLAIQNARINVAVAKNKALPKFDLIFRYTINGLSDNPGNAFDQMTTSNFQDYYVGISFEYPIGNRGPRAELKKAILQRDQAIAALRQIIEGIILEVDVAVRNLQTAYYQVKPSLEAVQAAEENLAAIVARRTRLSPEYLEVRLNAQETLANARRGLLNALVKYNIAVVQLERAKDTLLQYDNVEIQAQ